MNTEQSKQSIERTFVATVLNVVPSSKLTTMVTVMIGDLYPAKFEVLGDGSEWKPGQDVDVVLRHVAKLKDPSIAPEPISDEPASLLTADDRRILGDWINKANQSTWTNRIGRELLRLEQENKRLQDRANVLDCAHKFAVLENKRLRAELEKERQSLADARGELSACYEISKEKIAVERREAQRLRCELEKSVQPVDTLRPGVDPLSKRIADLEERLGSFDSRIRALEANRLHGMIVDKGRAENEADAIDSAVEAGHRIGLSRVDRDPDATTVQMW